MTRLRPWTVAREHPIAVGVVAGVIAVQAAWMLGVAVCPRMSMTECIVSAIVLVLGASAAAIVVRIGWLAATTARALSALPQAPMPPALEAAAQRAGIARLRCLAGSDRTAFCAGLFRPRVYVTTATASLNANELDAILAHEAAHAHRHDPLRRLVTRAAADVIFWFPLLRWWLRTHVENAELHADKAAIDHAGRQGWPRRYLPRPRSHQYPCQPWAERPTRESPTCWARMCRYDARPRVLYSYPCSGRSPRSGSSCASARPSSPRSVSEGFAMFPYHSHHLRT
jgi:BlaR1 peptidase M56